MARGWNGFYVGDRVEYELVNSFIQGTIIHLYVRDKNKGRIKMDGGEERDVILDYCKRLKH